MKLLPAIITLLAGACTSVITFLLHYEVKKALWILLIVLILFYILGVVFQKVIFNFEKQIAKEEEEKAEEEGKVVEKDISGGEDAAAAAPENEGGEDGSGIPFTPEEGEAEEEEPTET